jgi:hypothetical protein
LSKTICKLTHGELIALQQHGIFPNCKNHHHCSKSEAINLVLKDEAYPVTGFPGFENAIVEHESNGYVWKTRPSSGYSVRQLVRVVQG